jgi:predicted transposase/invertase (TIGR01784 family)
LKSSDEKLIVSVEIIANKEFLPNFMGGKLSRLDVRARLADGTRVNIEVQLEDEYNLDRRSLH